MIEHINDPFRSALLKIRSELFSKYIQLLACFYRLRGVLNLFLPTQTLKSFELGRYEKISLVPHADSTSSRLAVKDRGHCHSKSTLFRDVWSLAGS